MKSRAAFLLPLAAAAALAAVALATPVRPVQAAWDRADEHEVQRLRTHFAHLERELLTRDVSGLTESQRAARARNLAVLREYAAAGRFPHNHHVARTVPYFVDDHGTLCAMAYLIARSGRDDLVRRVAAVRNNAFVRDLVDDPEIVAWLDENGLTAYEAGRIQPAYGPPGPIDPDFSDNNERPWSYAGPSLALGGINAGLVWLSARARTERAARWRGAAAMAGGGLGLTLGMVGLQNDESRGVAAANLTVGAVTAFVGAHTFLTADGRRPEVAVHLSEGRTLHLAAAPVVTAGGGTGVHFNVRF